MKKMLLIVLAAVLAVSAVSCGTNSDNKKRPTPNYDDPDNPVYGLTLAEDGTMLLDGEPVNAYGVNLFDVFVNKRIIDPEFDLDTPFKALHDDGIRVVRTCMGPFYTKAFAVYQYSEDEYFEALDAVVAAAEKYEVGIIASMMWNFTLLVDWAGENVPAIGDKNSKTMEIAKSYFTDVVARYKDSPAIWAWEMGNEYNLGADLKSLNNVVGTDMPGVVRTEADFFTSYDISALYHEVGQEIKKIDPYRIILGGDSELSCRPAALRNKDSWEEDEYDDVLESSKLYGVEPMGGISSHFYHSNHAGQAFPDYSTDKEDKVYDQWIKWAMDACQELKIGYYIGEYGPGEALNNGKGSDDMWEECIKHLQTSFLKNNVQIALGWVCVNDFTGKDSLKGFYRPWYDSICEINYNFRYQGKQNNIDSYWAKAKKSLDFEEAAHKVSNYFMGHGNPGVVLQTANYNGWNCSDYDTSGEIEVTEAPLADGTTGKVFKITGKDGSSKVLLKYSGFKGLKKDGSYRLTFYLKTTDAEKGLTVKMGSPNFFTADYVKSSDNGQWEKIELDVGAPAMNKDQYSLSIYFEGQSGEVQMYGFRLTDA